MNNNAITRYCIDTAYLIATLANEGMHPTKYSKVRLSFFTKICNIIETTNVSKEQQNDLNNLIIALNNYAK